MHFTYCCTHLFSRSLYLNTFHALFEHFWFPKDILIFKITFILIQTNLLSNPSGKIKELSNFELCNLNSLFKFRNNYDTNLNDLYLLKQTHLIIHLPCYTCHATKQIENLDARVIDFLGRLARSVRRAASLTFTGCRLHVVVLIGKWGHILVTVPQSGHWGNSSRESANRMEWSFEWKLVVRDLVWIAESHAGLHAHNVPAGASLYCKSESGR